MKAHVFARFPMAGMLVRWCLVALMVFTTLLALPSNSTAQAASIPDVIAQGAGSDVNLFKAAKTPTPDDDEDEDDDDDAKPTKTPTSDDDDDDSKSKKKTPTADAEDLPEDWLDAGLISETEYESPQFGYAVEWDAPWILDDWYDEPSNGDSARGTVVTEDEETGADDMHIWDPDTGVILQIQGIANEDELTGKDLLDRWQSDEYYEGFGSPAELLTADGDEDSAAAIFSLDTDDGLFIGYNQVTIADRGDTLIFYYFLAPVEAFEDGYGEAQDEIQVDGDDVFDVLTNRDVQDVIEDLDS